MSVNLETVLQNIQAEKDSKLTANNLRYGINCMGVQGGLKPISVEGGDIGRKIYLQGTAPALAEGIWMNTDKTYDDIYIENERYSTDGSIFFSNADTTDPSNVIANHTNNDLNLLGATYAQRGNVVHFFGFHSSTSSAETTALTQRHWKYDFDTNTWTQLSDCPTPQGGVKAVWVGDYIYIFGTAYGVNEDYRKYSYKYDTINDTWERLTDLPTIPSNITSRGLGCVYDENDTIYIIGSNYYYAYAISTNSYTAISSMSNTTVIGYNNVFYYDNCVYVQAFTTSAAGNCYMYKYNPATSSWTSYGTPAYNYVATNAWWYILSNVLINDRIYSFASNTNALVNEPVLITQDYGWISISDSSSYKKITTTNPYSSTIRGIQGVPVCHFSTNLGDTIIFFAGISTGTTKNSNNQIGILVEDKDYSGLENNTLIIYSTDGTMGTYTTPLYADEKAINGKIYQRFNDVNLWDATNQKLIKDITTYYGNGTSWVQI